MIEEAIKAIGALLKWLNETREARRQSREWTVTEEAAYEEHIASRMREDHWKPDSD